MAIHNYLKFNVQTVPNPQIPNQSMSVVQIGPHALFSAGLAIDLAISVDSVTAQSLQATNIPLPYPIISQGLFDTGCTVTSIDQSVATTLGLRVRGYTTVHTANGPVNVGQYLISLAFPGTQLKGQNLLMVNSVNLSGQPFQVLIGRDLMSLWSITYNGPAGFISIAD
jgi:hypothetical protein